MSVFHQVLFLILYVGGKTENHTDEEIADATGTAQTIAIDWLDKDEALGREVLEETFEVLQKCGELFTPEEILKIADECCFYIHDKVTNAEQEDIIRFITDQANADGELDLWEETIIDSWSLNITIGRGWGKEEEEEDPEEVMRESAEYLGSDEDDEEDEDEEEEEEEKEFYILDETKKTLVITSMFHSILFVILQVGSKLDQFTEAEIADIQSTAVGLGDWFDKNQADCLEALDETLELLKKCKPIFTIEQMSAYVFLNCLGIYDLEWINGNEASREDIIRLMNDLANADGKVTPEEQENLDFYCNVIRYGPDFVNNPEKYLF